MATYTLKLSVEDPEGRTLAIRRKVPITADDRFIGGDLIEDELRSMAFQVVRELRND